ncbi:MAG: hypothetical protein PHP46_01630 [Candidatus Omnitrophica bacterium]|nr:hypothetical protein [Candidatus Omnitrophota bacterium]
MKVLLKILKLIAVVVMVAVICTMAYEIYVTRNELSDAKKELEHRDMFTKSLKDRISKQDSRMKDLEIEVEVRDKRINVLEETISMFEQKTVATYFVRKSVESKVLLNRTFRQVIELEPIGDYTIPLLSVIAQTRDNTKIKLLKVEGKTILGKGKHEQNKPRTLMRVVYNSVKPAAVKITIVTQKETSLDVIIDPYREM